MSFLSVLQLYIVTRTLKISRIAGRILRDRFKSIATKFVIVVIYKRYHITNVNHMHTEYSSLQRGNEIVAAGAAIRCTKAYGSLASGSIAASVRPRDRKKGRFRWNRIGIIRRCKTRGFRRRVIVLRDRAAEKLSSP